MEIIDNHPLDILLAPADGKGRLTKVGVLFPTPRGAGYRTTLRCALPEGTQLVFLPSRNRTGQDVQDEPAGQ